MDSMRWRDAIETRHNFIGTKLALFVGSEVLAYRRDDKPTIPYPNCWDLPGGGRENDETPFQCGARELEEEFALPLQRDRLRWAKAYESVLRPNACAWFIVGELAVADIAAIRFGDEGQEWRMMPSFEFLRKPDAVYYLRDRLADYLACDNPDPVG